MAPSVKARKPAEPRKDESFKFRPSPNFKHMKKYLKSRYEESTSASRTLVSSGNSVQDKGNAPAVMIQPALPPYTPPPLSPVPIKQEGTDYEYSNSSTDEYQNSSNDENEIYYTNGYHRSPYEDMWDADYFDESMMPTNPPITDDTEPIMCRNFIRKTCRKGSACRFEHRIIHSQLPLVYNFCKDFQNRGCMFICRYVHATIFEQEHFYRTAYLPDHCTVHLRQNHYRTQNPTTRRDAAEYQMKPQALPKTQTYRFNEPAVPATSGPLTLLTINANAAAFQFGAVDSTTSSVPREWTSPGNFTLSPPVAAALEPPATKCNACDNKAFRCAYNMNKVQELRASEVERNKVMGEIDEKYRRLQTVLMCLYKPLLSEDTQGTYGLPGLS